MPTKGKYCVMKRTVRIRVNHENLQALQVHGIGRMIGADDDLALIPQRTEHHVAGVQPHVQRRHADVPERHPDPSHHGLHLGGDGVVGSLPTHHAGVAFVPTGVEVADEGLKEV